MQFRWKIISSQENIVGSSRVKHPGSAPLNLTTPLADIESSKLFGCPGCPLSRSLLTERSILEMRPAVCLACTVRCPFNVLRPKTKGGGGRTVVRQYTLHGQHYSLARNPSDESDEAG